MLTPKKYSYKEFDNEKKFLLLENPPHLPCNFSNGPSLSVAEIQAGFISNQYLFRAVIQIMVRTHNDQF